MDNVGLNIFVITAIFTIGISLCFTQSVLLGMAFIILGNAALPLLIQVMESKPKAPESLRPRSAR